MDGNGRWAQARGLPRLAGHRAGIEAVRRTVRAAISHGVPYLTLFAFSSENWHRAPQEVSDLTGLLRYYLRHKVAELHDEGVRIRFIGDFSRFDEELRGDLVGAEILTRGNSRLTLTLALSYGGRSDIMQAASRLAQAIADRDVDPARLTERDFSRFLLTADTPDPDLIVRTSGEYRLSNFLLWQSAYAELVFRDVLWPDFDEAEFAAVMALFARRERRFGVRPA
ncbi:di-trans,poly-cis-decaprenylcistransferase [Ameyamaea chiangmaiensis]|uniref:Isoprenyl transferase n=1 Tax=Ameyamaea chiangmaiensis TaxID=442969 RepID=A0A850P9A4_9PROT|nr:polyprenyl diphosphate synthase [Ameyamaea chiangmaiensis]MBS4074416.1 di-trans,poly-cis-decaprenylcistransferase [Ameyamaea chiangmaiensis]NVN40478.1 di-trans,poly-cis-decaprenylcistransferase [Ameyamaea chiangmaiensis]